MVAHSAGLSPATVIAPLTRQVLAERNIRIDDHFPKGLDVVSREKFDMVVNLSGMPLRVTAPRVVEWAVKDRIGRTERWYRTVAAQTEGLVMRLIREWRQAPRANHLGGSRKRE